MSLHIVVHLAPPRRVVVLEHVLEHLADLLSVRVRVRVRARVRVGVGVRVRVSVWIRVRVRVSR